MALKMTRQFKQRLSLGSLSVLALIICIYYSFSPIFKPFFILLNFGVISLALIEYYHLAQCKGFQPLIKFGIGTTFAYILSLGINFFYPHLNALPSLILLICFIGLFLMFFKNQQFALGNLAVTAFGIIYLTIPLACVLRINYFFPENSAADGRFWLAYVLIVSKMTDISAYFCGKIFGKTTLAPLISPKKTLEGAIGGIIAAVASSMILAFLFAFLQIGPSFKISFIQSIWIGLLISILAQVGDLGESVLKRDAGVKDSSHLPGLGGILDVVDSLIFTIPLMYLLLEMHFVG